MVIWKRVLTTMGMGVVSMVDTPHNHLEDMQLPDRALNGGWCQEGAL